MLSRSGLRKIRPPLRDGPEDMRFGPKSLKPLYLCEAWRGRFLTVIRNTALDSCTRNAFMGFGLIPSLK